MKVSEVISTVLSVLVSLPIWFYLLYKILQAVNASELMWFLFWIYMPASLIINILFKVKEGTK
jgi:hypothetical protein